MEKNEGIAVENGGGIVGDVGKVGESAVENSGGIEKKEAIAVENNGVSEKMENEVTKGGKKKAAGVGQKKKKLSSRVVISAAADATPAAVTSEGGAKGSRVQVSNTKKPLFFYLNVAKRYIKHNNYVELTALGMAIPTVVTISEMLKKDGWVTEKKIGTSTVTLKDEAKGRVIMKAKIEILLEKHKNLENHKGSAAKCPSKISEKEQSSESNGKLIEKKDQSESNGTLTEKKNTQNTEEVMVKEASANNGNLSVKKDACGSNGKMADKENTEVALAADGK